MRPGEKKAALLTVTESIEMELFSSEEQCKMKTTQKKEKKQNFHQRYLDHPLVPDCEDDPEPLVQIQSRQQAKTRTKTSVREETEQCPHALGSIEKVEIEMEVFPPIGVSESDLVTVKSDDSSVLTQQSPNKVGRLKWKSLIPQRAGLVVKDVVCLPRGHYMSQVERQIVPPSKEGATLAARGMTARITIDCSWSANQMESRLVMLFQEQFVKRAGQRFSFTYLQCLQGSRVLFFPDTPAEGWTGEQVLRICGHDALYILSHHDVPQASERGTSRVASGISQFTDGLNSCGRLWDMVQSHWEAFVPVVTGAQQQQLPSLAEFKRLFNVCYSHPDSPLRPAEEATAEHWEKVLTLVSDGQADFSFKDLLTFITGTDHPPPLGNPRSISLRFYSQDANTLNVRLPHASKDSLDLFLPRDVVEAVDLLVVLSRAVHDALDFIRLQVEKDGQDS